MLGNPSKIITINFYGKARNGRPWIDLHFYCNMKFYNFSLFNKLKRTENEEKQYFFPQKVKTYIKILQE